MISWQEIHMATRHRGAATVTVLVVHTEDLGGEQSSLENVKAIESGLAHPGFPATEPP